MYKHLLVPTDGSELSGKAVSHAIGLARALGARMTAFYASPEYPTPIVAEGIVLEPVSLEDYEARANEEAQAILKPVVQQAEAAGVSCNTEHLIASVPWEAILNIAKKVDADAIVMASHGRRGLSAMLLGSETQRVLTHSTVPVIVVRG
jgi:nucleotide-binding universal stress UspA family protein